MLKKHKLMFNKRQKRIKIIIQLQELKKADILKMNNLTKW